MYKITKFEMYAIKKMLKGGLELDQVLKIMEISFEDYNRHSLLLEKNIVKNNKNYIAQNKDKIMESQRIRARVWRKLHPEEYKEKDKIYHQKWRAKNKLK